MRELQRHFAPRATFAQLRDIAQTTPIREFKAGEVVAESVLALIAIVLLRRWKWKEKEV